MNMVQKKQLIFKRNMIWCDVKIEVLMATEIVSYPKKSGKNPGILIAHAWRGLDEFVKKKADALAELGYVAFAADVYDGKTATTDDEAFALMSPLFKDRELLRKKIGAAYDALKNLPEVDPERIGAIGFCFGGLTVLELLRSGAPVKGIVSFHGVLGTKMGDLEANIIPSHIPKNKSALFLHGDLDPLVPLEDILALKTELTESEVDWQFHIFGNTVHAFTNPEVHDFSGGLSYNRSADKRSWTMMRTFFEELFNTPTGE